MKYAFVFASTALAVFAVSRARPQTPNQPAPPQSTAAAIPPGVRLVVRLKSEISAATAKAGDPANLEFTEDVKSATGEVLLPKKAALTARIAGARAYAKDLDARLSIVLERAEWEGHSVELSGILSAVPLYPQIRSTAWKGPGGPAGVTIGDPARGPVYTPKAPGNKPEFPVLQPLEGLQLGYLPDLQTSVLICKTGDIHLPKGTVIEFRQRRPH